ncbi:phosphotransferase [Bacillus tuaregi]|uniref:phosphotransferase n=1 Tax=Bacillus tuaregi TaxID=1816695 RepID=UPI0008F91224|nr:phosphotransferase [Bacillus tuaregi]
MNITIKFRGDDGFHNRLLSYLKQHLPFQILSLTPLRKNVYIVSLKDGFQFVLKGYSSLRRLKIQEVFTQSLKKAGFDYSYSFYSLPNEHRLFFESQYFGFLEYLRRGENTFYYDSMDHCQEGLTLLQSFHIASEKLVDSYRTILPAFHLIDKWEERLQQFQANAHVLSSFLQKEVIEGLIYWAEWSLTGLRQEKESLYSFPNVILHGDVAHHNFFRISTGELYLIDFDLISTGPSIADYLQYSNRILPFLSWSIKELSSFQLLQSYFQHPVFLYALAFPTDIFREWNRLVKEHTYNDVRKVRSVMELTLGQLDERLAFYKQLETNIN